MKVYLLVARLDEDDGEPWVVNAYDEWTGLENDAVRGRCEEQAGVQPENLRWLTVNIPDDALARAFEEVQVEGELEG